MIYKLFSCAPSRILSKSISEYPDGLRRLLDYCIDPSALFFFWKEKKNGVYIP
jgi:hypothetical protein